MNAWQYALTSAGAALDLFGLALTGLGLYYTWRDHASGEPFLPAVWSEFTDLLRRVTRRRRQVTRVVGTAWGVAEASSFAHGSVGFASDASVDERLALLKQELDAVSLKAARAEHEVEQVR